MPFRWTVALPARHYRSVSLLLALLACWLGGSPAWAATIERVDIGQDRIVIRFDQSVADASSFVLRGPQRIAVDVDGASPGTPVEETAWSRRYAGRRAARMAPASCSTSPGPRSSPRGRSALTAAS